MAQRATTRRRYVSNLTLPIVRRKNDGEYVPAHIISPDTKDDGSEQTYCGVTVGQPGPDFSLRPGWQYAARFYFGADCQKCRDSYLRRSMSVPLSALGRAR